MTKNEELKHAEDIFDALTESYLMHYGTPGMHWRQQGPGKRWQSQAVYAQGRLNPDARVKGQNEVNAAKKRMAIQNETLPGVPSDLLRKRYPSQKLSDLNRLDGKPTFETRKEINHPSNEKGNEAGRHYNCPNCATAFEMQERGYDVIARPAKNGSNVGDIESNFENGKLRSVSGQIDLSKLSDLYKNMQNTEKRYKNTSFNNVKKRIDNAIEARKAFDDYYTELNNRRSEAADNAIRSIQSQGKNARGIVVVGWAQYENPSRRTSLYHAFNYKNENGVLKFYDTQSNHEGAIKGYSADDAKKAIFPDIDPREIYVMRTDGINVRENVTNSVYSPDRSKTLQHAESVFDALTESYLMHYGLPGMEWYKNKAERYQPQAQYARFIPNPNGRVRGQKEGPAQRIDVAKVNKLANKGVRDQSLTKDHIVPMGTTIYRGKDTDKETLGGSKYVTYLDGDRDNYRYLKPGHEYTYSLTKDLKVAGRDKFIEAIDAATKDDKVKEEVVKNWLDYKFPEDSLMRFYISLDDNTGEVSKKNWDRFVKNSVDEYLKKPIEDRWFQTSQAFANTPKVKNAVVDYLKKKGYDALIDEAAVGGRNGYGREGVAPMLIFDSSDCLKQNKVTKTPGNPKKNQKNWSNNINKYNRTEGEWSDSDTNVLKHAESVFDALTETYLMHYGTPGMHWRQQGPGKRYQSQAVYAQGRPNPNGKVRGQKEKPEKVNVLSKKDFHNLSQSEQVRIHTAAAEGKNYDFTKKIRDSIQNEKDGSSGRVDSYIPARGPAQLNWEKKDGKVIFREPLFNRKVSDKYADNILNSSMFGEYSRRKT